MGGHAETRDLLHLQLDVGVDVAVGDSPVVLPVFSAASSTCRDLCAGSVSVAASATKTANDLLCQRLPSIIRRPSILFLAAGVKASRTMSTHFRHIGPLRLSVFSHNIRVGSIMTTSKLGLFLLICAASAFGQGGLATITGTVGDPSGAVIANASIQVRNTANGQVFTAASTDTGNFTVLQLPIGDYDLVIAVPGFKTYNHNAFHLAAQQRLAAICGCLSTTTTSLSATWA